jgi:hypothetical protein
MAAPASSSGGDAGKISHRLADASLERRGNMAMRHDLEDKNRLYDPKLEKKWEQKYKFHSARQMKRNFRVFAQARHDPFNKDPAWGKAVLGEISDACAHKGKNPDDLFKGIDLTGDGTLNRPEMKKVICQVFPALSDAEVTAVFDTIDEDHSGEVNVEEFVGALKYHAMDRKTARIIQERHRNPIHRMVRIPPAPVEGWGHLKETEETEHLDQVVNRRQHELMARLGSKLVETPRALKQLNVKAINKYTTFSGGGEVDRFLRSDWHKSHGFTLDSRISSTSNAVLAFGDRDPGPDLRPGFMCDPESRKTLLVNGWRAATPRNMGSTL